MLQILVVDAALLERTEPTVVLRLGKKTDLETVFVCFEKEIDPRKASQVGRAVRNALPAGVGVVRWPSPVGVSEAAIQTLLMGNHVEHADVEKVAVVLLCRRKDAISFLRSLRVRPAPGAMKPGSSLPANPVDLLPGMVAAVWPNGSQFEFEILVASTAA
ncbi:MAG: hypothetical protein WCW16_02850 [Candidatus Magasanikbacteria bacterium]